MFLCLFLFFIFDVFFVFVLFIDIDELSLKYLFGCYEDYCLEVIEDGECWVEYCCFVDVEFVGCECVEEEGGY